MHVKRGELERQIAEIARQRGLIPVYIEGGNHTKVRVGGEVTFIPRHHEIREQLARDILKTLRGE